MIARTLITLAGLTAIVAGVASCASNQRPASRSQTMHAAQPAIELLGFPGCPNTPELRESLRAALTSIGEGWTFKDTNQEALPVHDLRRGWPTPTILVNGRDLFGMPAPTAPSMGCRMYPGGVPEAKYLAEKLKSAAGE